MEATEHASLKYIPLQLNLTEFMLLLSFCTLEV